MNTPCIVVSSTGFSAVFCGVYNNGVKKKTPIEVEGSGYFAGKIEVSTAISFSLSI